MLEFWEFLKDSFIYIIIIISVIFISLYVVSPTVISGPSMDPVLADGDLMILNKLEPKLGNIDRFEIVVAEFGTPNYIIKRVIGLPGEIVEYKNNKLYINNEEVVEDFINDEITSDFKISDLGYDVIPEDMYFLAGDNRNESLDSRDKRIGLLPKEDIIGVASLTIWPIKNIKAIK
jgi:signal peptidase I